MLFVFITSDLNVVIIIIAQQFKNSLSQALIFWSVLKHIPVNDLGVQGFPTIKFKGFAEPLVESC